MLLGLAVLTFTTHLHHYAYYHLSSYSTWRPWHHDYSHDDINPFPGSLTIKEHRFMQDMLSEDNLASVEKLLKRIVVLTFTIEVFGAVALCLSALSLGVDFSFTLVFHSIFHSISAFCNAGLSSFPSNVYGNYFNVNFFSAIIICLIILGGIGFPLLANTIDFIEHRFIQAKGRKYGAFSSSSKLVGLTSVALWLFGSVTIYALEKDQLFSSKSSMTGYFIVYLPR